MLQKTLIIGLGGTGLATIREVRRLIAERYEGGLDDPEVAPLRFLYIDTDEGDVKKYSWSVLGKKIDLRPSECMYISGDQLGPIVRTPANHPEIDAWLPPVKDFVGEPGNGAKGIRPYGRLIYEHASNKTAIRSACVDLYNQLNRDFQNLAETRIHIIAGLSGGTGSGMAMPLAFDLLKWSVHRKGERTRKMFGFFVLPPLAITGRHDRYHQNAYAFLKELNYHAIDGTSFPFSNCYLVEPRNADAHIIGVEHLPLLIAQRIFLNLQSGVAATFADSVMDNVMLGGVIDGGADDRKHATSFSTFGLSCVSYPRETVAQCLSFQQAAALVQNWLEKRDYPKDIHSGVTADLHSLRLSTAHIWGDADPFGSEDHPHHETQVSTMVDSALDRVPKKKLGEDSTSTREDIERNYREVGIFPFYKKRINNVKGAAENAAKAVRLKITALLRNSSLGLYYTEEYLARLSELLTEEKKRVTNKSSEATDDKLNQVLSNLAETVNSARTNENKLIYLDRRFEQDRADVSDQLKIYLKLLTAREAAKYAATLLEMVLKSVESLRNDLEVWKTKMTDVADGLLATRESVLNGVAQGTKENGKVIFDGEGLEAIMSAVPLSIVRPAVEENIRQRLRQTELDLMGLTTCSIEEVARVVYEEAAKWVLSDACPIDVRRMTLYSKFIESYPRPSQRQQILQEAQTLSAVFTCFSPEQENIGALTPPTEHKITVIPSQPGNMVGNETAQAVVKRDVLAVHNHDPLNGDDSERIVFLQERQVFPLRCISLVADLKKLYDTYPHQEALHIDKRDVPHLSELFAVTETDKQTTRLAEESFMFARIDGWLQEVRRGRLESDGVYYVHKNTMSGDVPYKLGSNWEEALDRIVADAALSVEKDKDIRAARTLMTKRMSQRRQGLRENADERAVFGAACTEHLRQLQGPDPTGIFTDAYRRHQEIIQRLVDWDRA